MKKPIYLILFVVIISIYLLYQGVIEDNKLNSQAVLTSILAGAIASGVAYLVNAVSKKKEN